MKIVLLLIAFIFTQSAFCQTYLLFGKITNSRQEPVAFASVQVKELKTGIVTAEDGSYSFELGEGKYDLLVTMVGYKPQVVTVIVTKKNNQQDIVLEAADATNLTEVIIRTKSKGRAEDYIRNVIQHKEAIENARGAYTCKVYIKALQEDSILFKDDKDLTVNDSLLNTDRINEQMSRMALAEIVLQLDRGTSKNTIKEERTGVTKRGNTQNLFYLSTTEGDFDIYNNLIDIPTISQTPFLSPISYTGLVAYKFETIKTQRINGRKIYTISIRPRQMSNATIEGEITIADSSWTILHTKFTLPKYHLSDYDFFEVEQQYTWVNNAAWMITHQEFTYNASTTKKKSSGHTVATYTNFELNKQFDKKHFGSELSSASEEAYERDSSFWQKNRTEPLNYKEIHFIHYKDSIYLATTTKAYLDSMDKVNNKVTWKNVFLRGQYFNNHEKRRSLYIPALPSFYNPFQFGGGRLQTSFIYAKTYKSRRNIDLYSNLSYGFRNKDINGYIKLVRLYNPFNRGGYTVKLEKSFDYIFSGDAWINMIKRSNVYLNQYVGLGHTIELFNGFFLFTDVDIAFRRSVSDYKTNSKVDSLLVNIVDNDQPIPFESYNAFYGTLRLEYTPHQLYIREPKEKVILGSAWPTFYVSLKKGIPGILGSKVDFNYLEYGIKQIIKLGTLGNSSYTIRSGSFLSQKDLRLVDYKYQRRGDPLYFSNPYETFQSLDSTFPVFKHFYEGHYVHEFNGFFLNRIPLLKKLGLREIAGAGFLIAPERNNLRYADLFAGIERIFKYPFNGFGKFKVGVYVTGSASNQFHNPVQFKIGFTTWDRKNGKWF